jgi:hypothetical protein
MAAPAAAATLTRGPYLQLLTPRSVTVVWNTDVPAACSLAIGPVGQAQSVVNGVTATVCVVNLSGLTPGASYAYRPRADGVALRGDSIFQTDDPALPFAFLVVGDTGPGADQIDVRDQMLATPAEFILHTGDMIYDDGAAADFDPKFFTPYRDLVRHLVFWPLLGNHDWRTASGQPWRNAFYTPANNPEASENYYSFDYGNAHVVVLNTNVSTSPGSAQYKFADQDLGASTARWKFVAFHHTIYTSSQRGSALAHRANLVPLFDARAVDVVFMGHDHLYERTKPLRADVVVPAGQGTVYVTTGGGGRELDGAGTSSFTAYSESAFHFTRVAVDGSSLLVHMVRTDGSIGDTFSLSKGTGTTTTTRPPTTSTTRATTTSTTTTRPTTTSTRPTTTTTRPTTTSITTTTTRPTTTSTRPTTTTAATATTRPSTTTATTTTTRPSTTSLTTTTSRPATTSTTTPPPPPAGLVLGAMADTYIEAGAEAAWSHGGSDHADVDAAPTGIAYFKFDLRNVPHVARARLRVFCTNSSSRGGTVHAVSSATWPEGAMDGRTTESAGRPGIKWIDVDTNGDGVVDSRDLSSFVPQASAIGTFGAVVAGQTYVLDVTPAFNAGARVYTIALRTTTENGATYSTREHPVAAQRPVLLLD